MSYYNLLCNINKYLCKDNSYLRNETKEYLEIIDNAINKALQSCSDEEILVNSMQVAALIKLFQPFYDANHRTALIVFGKLITEKGFNFDYENALNDMINHKLNIPTIYNENDIIGNFDKWYKYISKEKTL